MSVSHSFCPQGLHSGFHILGVYSLCSHRFSFWRYGFLPPLFNSCGAGLGSGGSHTDTHILLGCGSVRLECSWGCGNAGLNFPMPIVNRWLYLELWGDLQCPVDPSPGPWPLARRLCLLPCWGTQWPLCVCVLMANLRRGSVIQSSAIQPPASTLQAASPSPRASHLSLKDNKL